MLSARSFSAIGTTCQVLADYRTVGAATRIAEQQLEELDRVCSRFREDSELSRLGKGTTQPISGTLTEVLAAGLRTAKRTDGLVDPTVGTALAELGYDADLDRVRGRLATSPMDPPTGERVPAPGYHRILLDEARHEVLIPRHVDVDLGASAKAWAADRVAASCARRLPGPFLINFGGDIAISGPPPVDGWQVAIEDDGPAGPPPVVTVRRGGLATSSTMVRTWRHGDRTAHHIIDPRTGDCAPTVWRTVSVVAATCELANAASTAAVVLGIDAPEWLARRGLPARLVSAKGRFVYVGSWPADEPTGWSRSA